MVSAQRQLAIIVAMDRTRGIGKDGTLPWYFPNDLQHFKKITMGHSILMGRKTYQSIGKALPGRQNLVLTKAKYVTPHSDDIEIGSSFELLVKKSTLPGAVMVIGGTSLYEQSLPIADIIYLTKVYATMDCDTFFPDFDMEAWFIEKQEDHTADERHRHPYSFIMLKRRSFYDKVKS